MRIAACLLCLPVLCAVVNASDQPWWDPTLPLDSRVDALVEQLTPAEMISQMVKWAPAIPRLGVPAFSYHTEGAHGTQAPVVSTVFPVSLARAASFNPSLEARIGHAIALEGRGALNDYRHQHQGQVPAIQPST